MGCTNSIPVEKDIDEFDRLSEAKIDKNVKNTESQSSKKTVKAERPEKQTQNENPNPSSKRESQVIIREIKPNAAIGDSLKNVPLFAHLNKFEREKLGGALEEKIYTNGMPVFLQGEPGNAFYIIKSGKAVVTQNDENGDEVVLTHLMDADYFGEQSILTGDIRHANVKAEGTLVLYELEKNKFNALFKKDRIDVTFTQRRRVAVSAEPGHRDGEASQDLSKPLPMVDMSSETTALVLKAVHKSLLFQNLENEHKENVARVMNFKDFKKGSTIIREGEDGNQFYIIETGEVDVFQKDQTTGENILVDNHGPGGSFGELALMYNAPRNATCVAVVDSRMRVLERAHFNKIIKEVGELRIKQHVSWLNQVEILKPLTNAERQDLAETMETVEYGKDEVLFCEGDVGDSMFLVVSGEVVFSAIDTNTGEDTRIEGPRGTSRPGGYFGERALLNDAPRAATVTATQPTRLLRIDRSAFNMLLGPLEDLLKEKEKNYVNVEVDTAGPEVKWVPADVRFNDLQDVGVLGKGSYGYVKLVRDTRDKNKKLYALKAVSKQRIVETHQKGHLFNEKTLMMEMDHPFITKLYRTFQDRDLIYFLLEPSLGGELFRILRREKMFPLEQTRFYSACVVLAFEYMHVRSMIYRDLKPENLLIDSEGYIKVTDFGFCKKVKLRTWTMCGTPEYMAPEIIQTLGHGKGADWWTVGIFIFEMLASFTPFYGQGGVMKMYDRIVRGKIKYPAHFSKHAKKIIAGLLTIKPTLRLGVLKGGAELIKTHPFFKGLAWDQLVQKRLAAPFIPSQEAQEGLANFNQRVKSLEFAPYVDDGTGWDKDF